MAIHNFSPRTRLCVQMVTVRHEQHVPFAYESICIDKLKYVTLIHLNFIGAMLLPLCSW
jgi:hypothetical protein